MHRYALRIEYDGTPFRGWQRQVALASVQGAVEAALRRLDPQAPSIAAAGRTDTGVHATAQVAHCDLARAWDAFRLRAALNAHLRPHPVAVLAAAPVPEDFHARFSAIERAYVFRILNRRAPPALDAQRVWHVPHPLDATAMQAGAAYLVGQHDFTSFRASQCQALSPVKTLDAITVTVVPAAAGQEIRIALRARSFLHNQVRSIVGTLERVGAGAWAPHRVRDTLEARDRAACGPVAPPQGLCLTGVRYPVDPFA
ncbi:MAG: tRNA pseudouridine(38-40) synthase TruA [Rhodobacteraceae bacterium]|nr:tRNA pseudouridine(38-40) synthase TruA [Paracoccaceae bacterium]